MNAKRSSLYMGVFGVFVLAVGCQQEDTYEATNTAVQEQPSLEDRDDSDANADPRSDDDDAAEAKKRPRAPKGPKNCLGTSDDFEPNERRNQALDAPLGSTNGLAICKGDEDWFRVVVPANTIVRVGIEMDHTAGDLDLVVYDSAGKLVGGRYGNEYPSSWGGFETNSEYYGLYAAEDDAEYFVRVVAHDTAENAYSLHVDHSSYTDGASCQGAGFSALECSGQGADGRGLLPFPFPDPKDPVVGSGYQFESVANYRFARRELIMLVRNALAQTMRAFPNTTPLSLLDICQKDGITPGYDIGDPRHPQSTHDQGGNIDIAYFQTDGSNNGEIVCGDGVDHADGYCTAAAKTKNFVDFPRQAFFMAKLFASPRTRVVGVDTVLAPLITNAAETLAALPKGHPQRISASELASFSSQMAYGNGWPYHHHHIHLSMKWWSQNASGDMTHALQLAPTEHSMFKPE